MQSSPSRGGPDPPTRRRPSVASAPTAYSSSSPRWSSVRSAREVAEAYARRKAEHKADAQLLSDYRTGEVHLQLAFLAPPTAGGLDALSCGRFASLVDRLVAAGASSTDRPPSSAPSFPYSMPVAPVADDSAPSFISFKPQHWTQLEGCNGTFAGLVARHVQARDEPPPTGSPVSPSTNGPTTPRTPPDLAPAPEPKRRKPAPPAQAPPPPPATPAPPIEPSPLVPAHPYTQFVSERFAPRLFSFLYGQCILNYVLRRCPWLDTTPYMSAFWLQHGHAHNPKRLGMPIQFHFLPAHQLPPVPAPYSTPIGPSSDVDLNALFALRTVKHDTSLTFGHLLALRDSAPTFAGYLDAIGSVYGANRLLIRGAPDKGVPSISRAMWLRGYTEHDSVVVDPLIYAASTRYRVQRFQSAMDELDRMDPERMHALEDRDMWIVRANYRNGTFFGDDSEEG